VLIIGNFVKKKSHWNLNISFFPSVYYDFITRSFLLFCVEESIKLVKSCIISKIIFIYLIF